MIYPSIRAITVDLEGPKKIKNVYYFDWITNKNDHKNISKVSTLVCAYIPFSEVE